VETAVTQVLTPSSQPVVAAEDTTTETWEETVDPEVVAVSKAAMVALAEVLE
jgi:hypothetical protein